ncbi:MAG: dUTP diphosphatase [Gemmatales bacterium]
MLPVPLLQFPEHADLPLPAYQTAHAAAMDLPAAVREPVTVAPGAIVLIPCGFSLAVPVGYEAQVRPRSGLAIKQGLTVVNAPGTIDADYRGEVKVGLINLGREPVVVERGMRIAQLLIAPVAHITWQKVDTLPETERGSGGFGHTGK